MAISAARSCQGRSPVLEWGAVQAAIVTQQLSSPHHATTSLIKDRRARLEGAADPFVIKGEHLMRDWWHPKKAPDHHDRAVPCENATSSESFCFDSLRSSRLRFNGKLTKP